MPHQPERDPTRPPTPVSREQIEQAMGLWRDAAHQVEEQLGTSWQQDFNRQITARDHPLRRYTTMPDLVQGYLDHYHVGTPHEEIDDSLTQVLEELRTAAGRSMRIFDYRIIDTATYFWRAQQLIAEQTGTGTAGEAMQEPIGQAGSVDVDPFALADLELAPLSPAARDELRRRMFAGEEVYPYQSAGASGRWVVWLTDEPGRVPIDVWEAIVEYWQTRAQVRREMSPAELVATYGLQGPPAQQAAAARLGALATLRADHPEHARQIVLYAYHEADNYLQALPPDHDEE